MSAGTPASTISASGPPADPMDAVLNALIPLLPYMGAVVLLIVIHQLVTWAKSERPLRRAEPAAPRPHTPTTEPAAPLPEAQYAPSPKDVLADAHTSFARLEQQWLDYVTDTESYFLTRPLLRADDDPIIAAYHQARYLAREHLDAHPDRARRVKKAAAHDAADMVAHAWRCWDAANAHALTVGLDPFTRTERVALRRARTLIDMLADRSLNPATREHYLRQLREQFTVLSTAPVRERDIGQMPQLTGGAMLALPAGRMPVASQPARARARRTLRRQ